MAMIGRSTDTAVLVRPTSPPEEPDELVVRHDELAARLALLDEARADLAMIAAEADDRIAAARAQLAETAIAHGGRRLTYGQAPSDPREFDRITSWIFGRTILEGARPPAVVSLEAVITALVTEAAPIGTEVDRVEVERAAVRAQLEAAEVALRERDAARAREAQEREDRANVIGEHVGWLERVNVVLARLG